MAKTATAAAAAAKLLQSCPTLCNPIDGSPPSSPVSGILQARTLEGVAISFSNAWKWKVKVKPLSHVQLLVTPWTAAYPAPHAHGIFQARVLEWVAIAFSRLRPGMHISKLAQVFKQTQEIPTLSMSICRNPGQKLTPWEQESIIYPLVGASLSRYIIKIYCGL